MARRRSLVTFAVVGALFVPVLVDSDSYPVSLYPMYSRTRPDVFGFVTARGLDADGQRVTLSLGMIGASDDPLIVAGELRSAIADGRAAHRCEQIAARVRPDEIDAVEIVAVEIVTERHEMIAYLDDDGSLVERTVHAECTT